MVDVEHVYSCPAHWRETNDVPGVDSEVVAPVVGSGVEESCQFTSFGIHTR